jgi:N-methylhydantoinase A
MSAEPHIRMAVDVGGTFIDFVLVDERTGEVRIEKIPSLPDSLAEQFVTGISSFGIETGEIRQIFHGMTVAVNALIQERGARVGLITTRGFRDVLEMGRGGRSPVYDFVWRGPPPIVPRYLRREICERITFRGEVITPVDLEDVDRAADYLVSQGVEAISVVFLHAYANSTHEVQARSRLISRHPNIPVSVSHEIACVWREYERASTTALNSFLQPTVSSYLEKLLQNLSAARCVAPIAIMQSNGGVASAQTASKKPIRTVMSGPAGGVIGARTLCQRLEFKNVICTDVGGTTYDVAIIEDGRIIERSDTHIAGRPIAGSLIDVTSVGAGGGSIAWLDHREGLQVGPQSAGATPGPVCFSRGGTQPTTTDAHLVLGQLDPDYFLGGRMRLDVSAATTAIERIGQGLKLDTLAAAHGIVSIAESNMANAIRSKTVARGLDPRDFVMLAYGGGGGLFACAVADELSIRKVIIPPAPANFSAWGILTSDYVEDEVRTRVLPFALEHMDEVLEVLLELQSRTVASIRGYGFEEQGIEVVWRLDLRFSGQEYTLTIDLDSQSRDRAAMIDRGRTLFVDQHRRLYGHGDAETPIELVSLRCRAIGHIQVPPLAGPRRGVAPRENRQRLVHFNGSGRSLMTQIMQRDALQPGMRVEGPVIVEEWTTTTVIPPRWNVTADKFGSLIIEPTT